MKIVPLNDDANFLLDAVGMTYFHFQSSRRRLVARHYDVLQIKIGRSTSLAFRRDSPYRNLFHELLVVCVESIEAVNLIVLLTVCRTVAKDEKRRKLLHRIDCPGPLHLLRFVEDQYGAISFDYVDWPSGLKVIQLFIYSTSILSAGIKRLRVNDHHIDASVRAETLDLMQLFGVIDERPHTFAVLLEEVLCCIGERLRHTFADSNAWHDNDEFVPSVMLIKFEYSFDVAVGFTCPGLHLDV